MKTYKLTSEKPFKVNGELFTGVTMHYAGSIKPKEKKPKTYKAVGGFVCKERSSYESGCVKVYKTRRGYAASLYKDGCFSPYYATCTLDK
jgi:hypothetical protein